MSITRSKDHKPMFAFHPTVTDTLTENLKNKIITSWNAFATLETSKYLAVDLQQHFNELKTIIAKINAASGEDQCAEALEALHERIQSMAKQRQFILKEGLLAPSTRVDVQGVVTNLVINLLENIKDLQKHLKNYQETPNIEKDEKTKPPESRRINKLKPEPTLSEEKKEQNKILVLGGETNITLDDDNLDVLSTFSDSEIRNDILKILAPIDLLNITLKYDEYNEIKGCGNVPLVPTLFNSIKIQKLVRLKDLLTDIANGEFDQVKKIIEKDPSLLLEKLEEKDYITTLSGQRANNGTALRTAFASEDTQMAAMIKAELIKVASEDVANAQFHEQFPEGWEATEEEKWAPIFDQLETLTQAIRYAKLDAKQDDMNDIISSGDPEYKLTVRDGSYLAIELATFRSLLEAKLNEAVTTGRHFNTNLLLQAFKIYDDHFDDYFGSDWSDPHAMLFWQQVIGTIEHGLPPPWVQAFCDGLSTTEEKLRSNIPQGRSLKIKLFDTGHAAWVSSDFYPLSRSRLGYDYAFYGRAGGFVYACGEVTADAGWVARAFRSLCQSKTACIQTFTPQLQNVRGLASSCLIL